MTLPILPEYRRIAIITNPSARGGRRFGSWLPRLRSVIRDLQIEAEWYETRYPRHATEIASQLKNTNLDMLLVCGGDGTVNEVVNGWIGSSIPLGVLPFGTSNIMARILGTHGSLEHACLKLFYGRPVPHRLGKVNGRYFVLMVGAGLDGLVVHRVDQQTKNRWLQLAFARATLKVLLERSLPRFSIKIVHPDHHVYEGVQVIVTLVHNYAGFLTPVPKSWFERAPLWAVIFHRAGLKAFIRYFAGMLFGRHHRFKDVTVVPVHNLEIQPGDLTIHYEVDGDYGGVCPVRVTLTEEIIRFIRSMD